jgi:hypothetical protein
LGWEPCKEVVVSAEYSIQVVRGKVWLCQSYASLEDAKNDNPTVKVVDENDPGPSVVPDLPPDQFDPEDAGENWDES